MGRTALKNFSDSSNGFSTLEIVIVVSEEAGTLSGDLFSPLANNKLLSHFNYMVFFKNLVWNSQRAQNKKYDKFLQFNMYV